MLRLWFAIISFMLFTKSSYIRAMYVSELLKIQLEELAGWIIARHPEVVLMEST